MWYIIKGCGNIFNKETLRPIIWDKCLEAIAYIPPGLTYSHLAVPFVVSSIDLLPVAD